MKEHFERFQPTDWSLVKSAAQDDEGARTQALGELVTRYRPALKSHVIARFRVTETDAEDLVQSFLLHKVLRHEFLKKADQERGRFRNFLARAIENFVLNEIRRQHAQKRVPAEQVVSLDELTLSEEAQIADRQDEAFNNEFIRLTVDETLQRMRAECQRTHQHEIWGVFAARMLARALDDFVALSYEQLVAQYHLHSDSQAYKLLHRAKQMFEQTLQQVVADYARLESAIAPEIDELKRLLAMKKQRGAQG
jgi:RNA polymerase sigma-70 factor (ECF subfamily)